MDRAYSLLKRSIVLAETISYRDNLSNQIICRTCGEPVYKKEMWVQSREDNTHFLSHYAGEQTACKERAQQGKINLTDKEKKAQLQKLILFDAIFREQILNAAEEITTKIFFRENRSNFEFSERITKQNLKIGSIQKLTKINYKFVTLRLADRVDKNLAKLDVALGPVNRHLTSQFGYQNLKFLTCVAVILTYQKNYMPIDEMLKSANIKMESNFNEKLYAYAKIILSTYIHWSESIEKINIYAKDQNAIASTSKPKLTKSVKKIPNEETSKICKNCNRLTYTINSKCPFCYGNLKIETIEERKIRTSKLSKSRIKSGPKNRVSKEMPANFEEAKLCTFCDKYSYTASDSCPKCLRIFKVDTFTSAGDALHPKSIRNQSIKTTHSVSEPPRQYCAMCSNYYISSRPNSCPACYKSSFNNGSLRYCPVHNETYDLEKQRYCPNCQNSKKSRLKSSSWLASQPWDEENLKAHKKFNK